MSAVFAGLLFFGFLGQALVGVAGYRLGMASLVVGFSVWLILATLGVVRERRLGPSRQTHPAWVRTIGRERAAFLWGIDLGSGLTTIVTYPGFWLLPMVVALSGDPLLGMISFGLYSMARSAPVVLGPLLAPGGPGATLRLSQPLRWVNVITAVLAIYGITQLRPPLY